MQDLSGATIVIRKGESTRPTKTSEDVRGENIEAKVKKLYKDTKIGPLLGMKSENSLVEQVNRYVSYIRHDENFLDLEPYLLVLAIFVTIYVRKSGGKLTVDDLQKIIDVANEDVKKKSGVSKNDSDNEIKFILYRYYKNIASAAKAAAGSQAAAISAATASSSDY